MPALLQDAYKGVSPAVLATWPGGVGALNVPIPLRGGGNNNQANEEWENENVSATYQKFTPGNIKYATIRAAANRANRNNGVVGGARKHRRRPTRKAHRKASRKVQRKSRRLTRRR